MKTIGKIIRKIFVVVVDIISVLLIVFALGLLLTVVFTKSGEAPNLFGYSAFRVMTGSMAPTMPTDSMIIVEETTAAELEVNDIITFYSMDPSIAGEVNTHRIIAIGEDEEGWYCQTRGDANNVEDPYVTREEELLGKVIFHSLFLGKAVRLLSNPVVFIPIILIPLLYLLVGSLIRTTVYAKKIAKEEEEKAVLEALEKIKKEREYGGKEDDGK